MASTLVQDLSAQVATFWSPIMQDELKENALLPNLVSKEYQGAIKEYGDTVKVSMMQTPVGSIKTVGTDHEYYSPEKLVMSQVSITANKVIEASLELDNLIDIQTQLGSPEGKSKIRAGLLKSLELKLNEYIYSLVAPSTSAPDHSVNAVTTFGATELLANRLLASNAKWGRDVEWIGLLGPSYWNTLLAAQTLTSSDYVGSDLLVPGNKNQAVKRFGFSLFEDNSDAMSFLSPTAVLGQTALFFHPDWLIFVMQQGVTLKLSDMHASGKRGYLLSAEMLVGGGLGNQGSKKHIVNYNV